MTVPAASRRRSPAKRGGRDVEQNGQARRIGADHGRRRSRDHQSRDRGNPRRIPPPGQSTASRDKAPNSRSQPAAGRRSRPFRAQNRDASLSQARPRISAADDAGHRVGTGTSADDRRLQGRSTARSTAPVRSGSALVGVLFTRLRLLRARRAGEPLANDREGPNPVQQLRGGRNGAPGQLDDPDAAVREPHMRCMPRRRGRTRKILHSQRRSDAAVGARNRCNFRARIGSCNKQPNSIVNGTTAVPRRYRELAANQPHKEQNFIFFCSVKQFFRRQRSRRCAHAEHTSRSAFGS